jgi:hypothetical protein
MAEFWYVSPPVDVDPITIRTLRGNSCAKDETGAAKATAAVAAAKRVLRVNFMIFLPMTSQQSMGSLQNPSYFSAMYAHTYIDITESRFCQDEVKIRILWELLQQNPLTRLNDYAYKCIQHVT